MSRPKSTITMIGAQIKTMEDDPSPEIIMSVLRLGNVVKAESMLDKLLRHHSDDLNYRAVAKMLRGRIAYERHHYDDAVGFHEDAARLWSCIEHANAAWVRVNWIYWLRALKLSTMHDKNFERSLYVCIAQKDFNRSHVHSAWLLNHLGRRFGNKLYGLMARQPC